MLKDSKKEIYKIDFCAGCKKVIMPNEVYQDITLDYEEYKEHIALCDMCFNISKEYGIKFS